MNPNFVVYTHTDRLLETQEIIQNLENAGYTALLSLNAPRINDIYVLDTSDSSANGIVFKRKTFEYSMPKNVMNVDDIAVIVWYNSDVSKKDLLVLAEFFKGILKEGVEKSFDSANGLLRAFTGKAGIQRAEKMSVKEKRARVEGDDIYK